jgi:hypothetical protein
MISKEIFVGLDNVDTSIPWLNDRLSTLATGNAVTLRELYTTNSERRIYPRCLVCLSSRTPHFRRDDVADRLLIFKVKRIPPKEYLPERALLKVIEQNRNKLLGELVQQLNKIVEYLNNNDIDNITCDFRLADFASFGKAVWMALGGQEAADEWETILQKMKLEQDNFATEDDTLPSVLLSWMGKDAKKGPIDPSSLISELRNTAVYKNIAFDYHDSRALGRRLSNIRSNLEERFGIVIQERIGHGNVKLRTFIKKGEPK